MAFTLTRQPWLVRLSTKRYRRLALAGLITVGIAVTCLVVAAVAHWQSTRVVLGDTRLAASQAVDQLRRGLDSRRGTLTFIRDTINRGVNLSAAQLQAVGASATTHTRHLLGTGLARAGAEPVWWFGPQTLGRQEQTALNRVIVQRGRVRGVWRVPSTFVFSAANARPLLVMLEPLRAPGYERGAVMGVFDLAPLLADFFASRFVRHYPVQVLDGALVLHQSPDWAAGSDEASPPVVDTLRVDAERWTLRLRPSSANVVQALSIFRLVLVALSVIAGLAVAVIVWLFAARTWILQRAVVRRTAALRRTSERLRQLATTDELTGLHNRRFFLERWALEHERARRYARPLSCLLIDVDGFKAVNDLLGHHVGDLVLKDVAKELRTVLRQSDLLARLGGDEFVIALPEATPMQAHQVAEKLRQVSIPVSTRDRRIPPVRLSVGISQVTDAHATPEASLQAADRSLYEDKRHARAAAAGKA